MKAMVITAFGGPEVFELREVQRPEPASGELLVKVMASSINPVDYKIRQAGSWTGIELPAIIGYDVSGVVEEPGEGVRDFRPGDEVYYTSEIFTRMGCYAEYHVVHESIVAKKPANLTHEEAASIPLAGGTAWDALMTRGHLQAGETVLVHGGAGGVGSLAVQIAHAAGAYVYATAGSYHDDLVKELGVDRMIDYKHMDFVRAIKLEASGRTVDLVFDTVGGQILEKSITVTRPGGRLVSIVNTTGDLNAAYVKNLTVHFLFLQRARYKLDALRTLLEREQIRPVIHTVFPLERVGDAHTMLENGKVGGKIVIRIGER